MWVCTIRAHVGCWQASFTRFVSTWLSPRLLIDLQLERNLFQNNMPKVQLDTSPPTSPHTILTPSAFSYVPELAWMLWPSFSLIWAVPQNIPLLLEGHPSLKLRDGEKQWCKWKLKLSFTIGTSCFKVRFREDLPKKNIYTKIHHFWDRNCGIFWWRDF